jgi:hypothetical protein
VDPFGGRRETGAPIQPFCSGGQSAPPRQLPFMVTPNATFLNCKKFKLERSSNLKNSDLKKYQTGFF